MVPNRANHHRILWLPFSNNSLPGSCKHFQCKRGWAFFPTKCGFHTGFGTAFKVMVPRKTTPPPKKNFFSIFLPCICYVKLHEIVYEYFRSKYFFKIQKHASPKASNIKYLWTFSRQHGRGSSVTKPSSH